MRRAIMQLYRHKLGNAKCFAALKASGIFKCFTALSVNGIFKRFAALSANDNAGAGDCPLSVAYLQG
jgi:hypothetical protein